MLSGHVSRLRPRLLLTVKAWLILTRKETLSPALLEGKTVCLLTKMPFREMNRFPSLFVHWNLLGEKVAPLFASQPVAHYIPSARNNSPEGSLDSTITNGMFALRLAAKDASKTCGFTNF